jgi:NADH:ubiquinone reductase (H+-translocating)
MSLKKIYIIGAGYGGIRALTKLSRLKNAEIFLIDKNPYHYLQTDVYDYLTSEVDLNDIAIDLYSLCASFGKHVTFLHQDVLRIDFQAKKIVTYNNRYTYDHLIIASGAQTMIFDTIEGLKDQFHGIKSLQNALAFKQKFEASIFTKIQNEGKCSRESIFHIVIAGTGLSGVEIAAQMADFAKEFYKGTGYLCFNLNITLINSAVNPLPKNSLFLQKTAQKRLEALGVKIITNSHVTKVESDAVILNHTTRIQTDFLIWTAGIMPSVLVQKMDIQKSKHGQIIVDEFFRLPQYPEVFAIGDNAALFNPIDGTPLAPTAQSAELSAEYIAANIKNTLLEKPLQKKAINLHGFLASLGGKYGAAELFGFIRLKGKPAYWLKKLVENNYRAPLQARSKRGYTAIIGRKD